jgi:spore maturation protein CgeB
MRITVFGLSVSSAWGNGHATLWRGLIHALARLGHSVVFFEWDAPWYAEHRDCWGLPNGELHLYSDWPAIRPRALEAVRSTDVVMVTSYCPHGLQATELALQSSAKLKVFYDLDTPITLDRLARGESVSYLGARGLRDFDLVLSYTGGRALDALRDRLGARRVGALYGSVDPLLHVRAGASQRYAADLSYLGTYAPERQHKLAQLFLEPARRLPGSRFAIGGSQYPGDFPWQQNIHYFRHVPPAEHAAFYGSSRLNLNITRAPMAEMGYCPSGRMFEVAACGAALISDAWEGLETFFEPGREILVAHSTEDVVRAMRMDAQELSAIGQAARERALAEHTVDRRAKQLIEHLEGAHSERSSSQRVGTESLEV